MIIKKENQYFTAKEIQLIDDMTALLETRTDYRRGLYDEIDTAYQKLVDFEHKNNISRGDRNTLFVPPELAEEHKKLLYDLNELFTKEETQQTYINSLVLDMTSLLQKGKDRYIEAVRGNKAKILADCLEILDALTKEDIKQQISKYREIAADKRNNIPKEAQTQSYNGAVWNILQILQLQIDALNLSEIPINETNLEDMIDARARSFYKKPQYKRSSTAEKTENEKIQLQLFGEEHSVLTTPTSNLLSLPDILFITGGDTDKIKLFIDSNKNRHLKYSSGINEYGQTTLTAMTTDGKEEYSAATPPGISKYKNGLYTVFHYLLTKYNDSNQIYVTYDMLVEDKVFSNEQTARNDFRKILGALQLTTIQYSRKGGKTYSLVTTGETTGGNRSRASIVTKIDDDFIGAFMVYLNPDLNWKEITAQFTNLPGYFFDASPIAKRIINLIFVHARRLKRHDFTLDFNTIYRNTLIKKIDSHAKRTIIDPITKAANEINSLHREYYNADYDMLTLDIRGTTPKDIINESKVIVTIKERQLTEISDMAKHHQLKYLEERNKKSKNQA